MDCILKANGLTKEYNGFKALDNVTISLERNKIYGLIGRNGAGKTTLMRMIAGLRIGCVIESPSLMLNMTAAENMRLYRYMRGIDDLGVEKDMLEFIDLGDAGRKKVKDFLLA